MNEEVSNNILILREYIKRYSPVETYIPGGGATQISTTADIISDLSDMADLTPDEVNSVMFERGFRLGRNNVGSFGWILQST